jgi:Predicted membrane protein (DUF2207)
MGTRRRRRLDALLLAGVAALVGVAALLAAAFVRSERITRLWAGADVGDDGAARVVEVIDYDFGNRERHGIFRDVPGLNPDDLVEVSSPSAPDQVQVTGTAQQTRLRIGDPYRTVSGRHRYRIAYPLAGVAPAVGWPGTRSAPPGRWRSARSSCTWSPPSGWRGPAASRAPPAPRPAARSASPSPAT